MAGVFAQANGLIIDRDFVALGIDHHGKRENNFSVHGDPTLPDHLLDMPARRNSGGEPCAVGEDQVAHVELTREIARRFNGFYKGKTGEVFPEPQALLTPTPKLPGTDGRKMSKSYGNTVMLTDPEPVVRQKLKTMVTDPARVRRSDPGNPDVCPVGDLHKIFSTEETMAKVNEGCRSAGIGCIECKGWAADALVQVLQPMQERRKKYEDNPRLAWDILEAGSAAAGKVADATMKDVRASMGMSLEFEPGRKH
jgi:tryptophanyl-tRNA synthetase